MGQQKKEQGPLGPIAIAIGADPVRSVVILSFSAKVDRVEFTPEQAREFAKQVVGRTLIADGTMPVPEPPRVTALKGPDDRSGSSN